MKHLTWSVRPALASTRPEQDHGGTPMSRRSVLTAAASAVLLRPAFAAADKPVERILVERVDSKYNTILVYRRGSYVTMTFGYNRRLYTESVANTEDDLELPVTYTRYMTATLAYAQELDRILEIGFGGGRIAWYLHRHLPKVQVTSVELDDKVVELSYKYFNVAPEDKFDIKIKDGRVFLMGIEDQYNVILVDAYRGPFVPFHLMTKEFYILARSRLRAGGVLAQNVEPSTMLFDASIATLQEVFEQVEFYVAGKNVVTVAYDGARRTKADLHAHAQDRQGTYGFRYPLPELLSARRFLEGEPRHEALTDDFAPVEALRAIEQHNTKWVEP